MGRPGYVLVARQMGKTNLLLNIKREFQNQDDLFVYIDVSNGFPTLRTFFRNIIDTAVKGVLDSPELAMELAARRLKTAIFPEHQEHELELSFLLENLRGTLVICLDEVDALAKTGFSDNVFSFIRSVYFSGRVNVASFERLTYLLSGVAEPTELIKNKNISPFNIGAKIYLEDFSINELSELATKAAVPISKNVIDRIYHWGGGHPRLSYELISLAEDRLLAVGSLTVKDVDEFVLESYLTYFDLPPIDHIRTLVQDDKEIRDAIMAIHYGRSEAISASVRTRLYLNGIIGTQQSQGTVSLKNKIIEAALSEDWLRGVDDGKRSAYDRAQIAFSQNNFLESVELHREYLSTVTERSARIIAVSRLGVSLMRLEMYEEAVEYLESDPITIDDSLLGYAFNRFHLGACLHVLGKQTEAKKVFEEIIACGDKPQSRIYYVQALVNLAVIESKNLPESADSVMDACAYVIDSIEKNPDSFGAAESATIYVAACYLRHKVYSIQNDIFSAENALRAAINAAPKFERITLSIMLAAYLAETKEDFGSADLSHPVVLIEDSTPQFRKPSLVEQFAYTEDRVVTLLLLVSRRSSTSELAARVLRYLAGPAVTPDQSYRIVASCLFNNFTEYSADGIVRFIRQVVDIFEAPEGRLLQRTCLLLLAIVRVSELRENLLPQLLESLNDESFRMDQQSTWLLLAAIRSIISVGATRDALEIIAAVDVQARRLETQDEAFRESGVAQLFYDYFMFLVAHEEGGQTNVVDLAKSSSASLKHYSLCRSDDYIHEDDVKSMEEAVHYFIASAVRVPVRRGTPKLGRNDVVSVRLISGEIRTGKYKRLVMLIENEGAVLVDE
jgi:tetratricopeptide (TPR) repeat protein